MNDKRPDRLVPKLLLSYDEASWSLGVSVRNLYTIVSRERIPVVRIGGKVLFRIEDLRDFVDRQGRGKESVKDAQETQEEPVNGTG